MEHTIQSHKFTQARNKLTAIIDEVQRNYPQIIKKRKASEDDVFIIKSSLLRLALSMGVGRRFKATSEAEKDGSWTITLEPFGLAVNAATKETAVKDLLDDARIYAEEFLQHRSLYLQSKNRKEHLPFVIQILLCTTDEELKETLRLAYIS